MADTKISGLPASTTPLAGTEIIPVVQSGVTKKVSVADLTSGRAISATQVTLTTGDLVIGTSGKGIDFSADGQATGMTSELLDDYEEGTFTPVYIGSSGGQPSTYGAQLGKYTKIGNVVTVQISLKSDVGTLSGDITISGLPFTCSVTGASASVCEVYRWSTTFNPLLAKVVPSTTTIELTKNASNAGTQAYVASTDMLNTSGYYNIIFLTATYQV